MKIYYIGCASDFFSFQDYIYTHGLKNPDSVLFVFHEFSPSVNIYPEDIVVLGKNCDYNVLKNAVVDNGRICTEKYVYDNSECVIAEWNYKIGEWIKHKPNEFIERKKEISVIKEETDSVKKMIGKREGQIIKPEKIKIEPVKIEEEFYEKDPDPNPRLKLTEWSL